MKFGYIIHGGAWDIPNEAVDDHLQGVQKAGDLANQMLQQGFSAIDTVEACVVLLEDDPTFDAGKGSFCNRKGQVEMDAIIATTPYRIGSVCALQNMKNPIKIARKVMEKTKHVLIAGEGAKNFALQQGFVEISPENLLVGRELERYHQIHNMEHFEPKDSFGHTVNSNGMGTVGCVCKDQNGNFAVAVSTGGSPFKMAGRVGDTPLWGSGGMVNSFGAVAATGYGEDLIRIMASYDVCQQLELDISPKDATQNTIQKLQNEVQGLGGLIAINSKEIGFAFNTPRMAYSYKTSEMDHQEIGINPL